MSRHLRLSTALIVFLSITGTTLAQQAGQSGQRGRGPAMVLIEQINTALADINLTSEQRTKIDAILTSTRQEARGMAQQLQQADPPTRRGMTRQLATRAREKIVAILTPDQAKQFEAKFQSQLTAAATQPAPIGQAIERLYDVLQRVDLDEQQKKQIEELFAKTRQEMTQLRLNPPGDGSMPQRSQMMVQQLRQQLASILSLQQQQRMREVIQSGEAGGRGRGGGPQMANDMQGDNAAGIKPGQRAPADLLETAGVAVGQPAPPFTLNTLDNHPVGLSDYKSKLLLLVFGNYSTPAFRQRAAAIEQVRRDYGQRINVVLVYTREAYPAGQWEVDRNKDEGILIEQPRDMQSRVAQARQARTALKLTAPFIVDTMDDTVATDYGGFTNAAVLVGRDGTVLAKQKWFEPHTFRPHIDEALKEPPKTATKGPN
ncbi:MAG TPA: deiodinase-like protein [Tepidisphaeraceae bacterium]|nr:deiodinase-like protein [Tepidisphaeraceae bacterium]